MVVLSHSFKDTIQSEIKFKVYALWGIADWGLVVVYYLLWGCCVDTTLILF